MCHEQRTVSLKRPSGFYFWALYLSVGLQTGSSSNSSNRENTRMKHWAPLVHLLSTGSSFLLMLNAAASCFSAMIAIVDLGNAGVCRGYCPPPLSVDHWSSWEAKRLQRHIDNPLGASLCCTLEDSLNIKPEVRRSLLLSSASFSFLVLIDVDMVNGKLLLKLIYTFRDYVESYPQVSTHTYRHLSVIEAGLAPAKTNSIILRSVIK